MNPIEVKYHELKRISHNEKSLTEKIVESRMKRFKERFKESKSEND